MLEKAAGYGYKKIGFILDRGYFSEPNIRYMDRCGYDFVIMVKGEKDLVSELILKHKGMFEQERAKSIRAHRVNGMTVKQKLFATDEKGRYFHLYYDDGKHAREREKVESRVDSILEYPKKNQGKKTPIPASIEIIACHKKPDIAHFLRYEIVDQNHYRKENQE